MKRLSHLYGAGPFHALLMLGGLAFSIYLGSRIIQVSAAGWIFIWLIGAVVVHDFVLYPSYALLDGVLLEHRQPGPAPAVPWKNHVRAPAVLAGILLLISFPLVFRLSETDYFRATGLHTSVYLWRWLAVTGCLFGASAALYGVRIFLYGARRRRRGRAESSGGKPSGAMRGPSSSNASPG